MHRAWYPRRKMNNETDLRKFSIRGIGNKLLRENAIQGDWGKPIFQLISTKGNEKGAISKISPCL